MIAGMIGEQRADEHVGAELGELVDGQFQA